MFSPFMMTSPDVGLCNKFITLTNVLLPAPEKPTMPYISPLSIVKSTSLTA